MIFDVDGVLVDSYQAHFESWKALLAEHGSDLSEEQFASTFGRTSREILLESWSENLDEAAIRVLDDRKEILYREIIARDGSEEPLASSDKIGGRGPNGAAPGRPRER